MVDKPPLSRSSLKSEPIVQALYTTNDLKRADPHIGILHLISGTTGAGEDFYAYVSVRPSLYEEFLKKLEHGEKMNVDSYGKVLQKGFGKVPPDEIKQQMQDEYKADPNFLENIGKAMEKLHPEAFAAVKDAE